MKQNRFEYVSDRLDYLNGKRLNELTDEEIIEFLALRQEVRKACEAVKETWNRIKEFVNKH